jgi:alkaline phosphatase
MLNIQLSKYFASSLFLVSFFGMDLVLAAPQVTRLTPPSELFSSGNASPVIARFLPDQRFDLQATIVPDSAEKSISKAVFYMDGQEIKLPVALKSCATGCLPKLAKNSMIVTLRAISNAKPGLHQFQVEATQSDGQMIKASGNFEIVPWVVKKSKISSSC